MIKERPILFSGPMVRAILEGKKTQTRRVVKVTDTGRVKEPGSSRNWHLDDPNAILACPFGQIGDRLWVRETFAVGEGVIYREDWSRTCDPKILKGKWKPSIFMPRDLCRISLEIVSVRVERLNDISEADAEAEGLERFSPNSWKNYEFKTAHPRSGEVISDEKHRTLSYSDTVRSFKSLWQSINGSGSWEVNPWVWVVEFKRLAL